MAGYSGGEWNYFVCHYGCWVGSGDGLIGLVAVARKGMAAGAANRLVAVADVAPAIASHARAIASDDRAKFSLLVNGGVHEGRFVR